MNYKFSTRELLLIKILTVVAFVIAFFYGTSYVANEITKSKNLIFFEVNKFNEKKQLLAQIKALENSKNLELSADDFLLDLTTNNISYEQKGDEILAARVEISLLSPYGSRQVMRIMQREWRSVRLTISC